MCLSVTQYVQTVLSTVAIDRVCGRLIKTDGSLDVELFKVSNPFSFATIP